MDGNARIIGRSRREGVSRRYWSWFFARKWRIKWFWWSKIWAGGSREQGVFAEHGRIRQGSRVSRRLRLRRSSWRGFGSWGNLLMGFRGPCWGRWCTWGRWWLLWRLGIGGRTFCIDSWNIWLFSSGWVGRLFGSGWRGRSGVLIFNVRPWFYRRFYRPWHLCPCRRLDMRRWGKRMWKVGWLHRNPWWVWSTTSIAMI